MIQVQIRDKKALQITAVCLALSLVGMAIFLAVKLVQWKDYVPVEATVEAINLRAGTHTSPNSRNTVVVYTFRYNGVDYRTDRAERFQSQKHVGTVRTIRCDPDRPELLEDVWVRNGLILMLCLGTVILALMVLGLEQDRRARAQLRKRGRP